MREENRFARGLPPPAFRSNPGPPPGFTHRMKTPTPRIFAALSLALTFAAHAENWPQWRGPAFNGTSPETGLPETWTKDSAKWATPLPGVSGATPGIQPAIKNLLSNA